MKSDINSYSIGQYAELSKTFTSSDVQKFADLIGDYNPLHLDEEFCKNTQFGRCIVHGTFYTGILGTLLGTELPGEGTILISQEHKFLSPVYVGDTVTAKVEVLDIIYDRKKLILKLECRDDNGTLVMEGKAIAKKKY